MVDLKPETKQEQDISPIRYRRFRLWHLLWFILGSAIVHGLLLLLFARYEATKPEANKEESKPIDFVVVPPEEETEEPPPETNNRAADNSIARQNTQPEKIPTTEEPEPVPEPAPAPAPAPEPAPVPEPVPEPVPAPAPEPSAKDLMSGEDAPAPEPEPSVEEPVATNIPPEPAPETNPEGSAADLLGGDYKKTLADGGADAFFSPEALTHKTVLNTDQIDALKDLNLDNYFIKVQKHIDKHEKLVFEQYYDAILVVDIQKNGQITELRIKNRSGPEEYDRRVIERFKEISPFPPIPSEFPLESLQDVPIGIYIE